MHIHFVGIGGIGMSGIATILQHQGYAISGCDEDTQQSSVQDLRAIGCAVFHGNNAPECSTSAVDILVYSSAIAPNNPEIAAAQKKGIPTISRALMLAELMRTKYSIAIAGSHGKTTTTSLIAHILIEAQTDPTVIIGGKLKNISTNARFGMGDFLVAEADESDRSLLNLQATLAILTNIDFEHAETYHNLEDVKQTFIQFLNNLPFYGTAFICIDDPHIRSLLPLPHIKTIKYGIDHPADIYADTITLHPDHSSFEVYNALQTTKQKLGMIHLPMPGKHNVLNALAAIALTLELGITFEIICQALKKFGGIERRFSFHGSYKNADVFDDYAHHPTEIIQTLHVARRRTRGDIIAVFQPHRFIRTQSLWDDFVHTFAQYPIDHLIITDIYAAGETPIDGVTGFQLVQAIKKANPIQSVCYIPYTKDFSHITTYLDTIISDNSLLLALGAGTINRLATQLTTDGHYSTTCSL